MTFICFKTTLCMVLPYPTYLNLFNVFWVHYQIPKTLTTPLDFQNLSWASHFQEGGKLPQIEYISFFFSPSSIQY